MYNVLCNGKATIVLSCGFALETTKGITSHKDLTQGLLSIFIHLLIVYGLETRRHREPTALCAGLETSEAQGLCQKYSQESKKFN